MVNILSTGSTTVEFRRETFTSCKWKMITLKGRRRWLQEDEEEGGDEGNPEIMVNIMTTDSATVESRLETLPSSKGNMRRW